MGCEGTMLKKSGLRIQFSGAVFAQPAQGMGLFAGTTKAKQALNWAQSGQGVSSVDSSLTFG